MARLVRHRHRARPRLTAVPDWLALIWAGAILGLLAYFDED